MHLDYPIVPYCGPINSQLQSGAIIQVKGQSHPKSNFFAISLQCGPSINFTNDVALYLSAAFTPPPRIIRNSLINNQWGPEESFGGFPTSVGQPFEIMILVEPNEYRIAFNGQHFTEYHHRIPFERITHVSLTGEVRIDSFSIWYNSLYNSSSTTGLYPTLPTDLPPGPSPYSSMGFTGGPPPYPLQDHIPYPKNVPYTPKQPQVDQAGQYPSGPYYDPTHQSYGETHKNDDKGGIGNVLKTAIPALTGGMAATAIGSRLFGGQHHRLMMPGIISGIGGAAGCHHGPKHKHKKSIAKPIAGLAAGAGAAALGAALLSGHHPLKKVFKHKHKGSWSHKGWGRGCSSSSSSSSEEE